MTLIIGFEKDKAFCDYPEMIQFRISFLLKPPVHENHIQQSVPPFLASAYQQNIFQYPPDPHEISI